ncbi:EamA family transporter [Bianquea renquensis]|jgi:membrane protein|uniref:EamA family transporter n=1 Tax=Bianquea renquensis TaxID=2763661 RepID=A0A926DUW0_9FIRM|nr:EamA family transporter [Bianquea renquensis]MBC8544526.1 EamA family transporter [Bianquea renquensis]
MMEVLAVIGTVVCYSLQNIFVKDYQNRCGVGIVQSLWFMAVKSLFTIILFWALNRFTLHVTGPTALFSFLFSVSAIFSDWGLIAAMELGKMAMVSMYSLIGSALIPFFYGACFLGEDLSIVKVVAIVLMCLSFVPSVYGSKNNGTALSKKARIRFIALCIICFVGNGFCALVLKLNQIAVGASGANDFMILMALMTLPICLVALLLMKRQKPWIPAQARTGRSVGCALGLCVFNGTASVLSMFAAKTLPSSIQFPIISGGQLILISLWGWIFFKEKITKQEALGILLALAAMIFFML